ELVDFLRLDESGIRRRRGRRRRLAQLLELGLKALKHAPRTPQLLRHRRHLRRVLALKDLVLVLPVLVERLGLLRRRLGLLRRRLGRRRRLRRCGGWRRGRRRGVRSSHCLGRGSSFLLGLLYLVDGFASLVGLRLDLSWDCAHLPASSMTFRMLFSSVAAPCARKRFTWSPSCRQRDA